MKSAIKHIIYLHFGILHKNLDKYRRLKHYCILYFVFCGLFDWAKLNVLTAVYTGYSKFTFLILQ